MEYVDIEVKFNFFKPFIMETFYVLLAVGILLVGFSLLILPRLLKSEKNIFLRMKNSLFGEFEYHQNDKDSQ